MIWRVIELKSLNIHDFKMKNTTHFIMIHVFLDLTRYQMKV